MELRHEVKVFPCSQDVEESVRALRIVARGSHQLALPVNVWHCGKSSPWCHPDWCARSTDSNYSQNSAGARTARRRVSGWEFQNKTLLTIRFLATGSLKPEVVKWKNLFYFFWRLFNNHSLFFFIYFTIYFQFGPRTFRLKCIAKDLVYAFNIFFVLKKAFLPSQKNYI